MVQPPLTLSEQRTPPRRATATTAPPPLVLVTGKGGVGKSTVAESLAEAWAADGSGRPVALVRIASAGPGGAGPSRRATAGAVRTVQLDAQRALRDGAGRLFGAPRLARLVVDNPAMRRLLAVMPGLPELAVLLEVEHLAESLRVDAPDGGRIVVDLPATGHAVAWLAAPRQLVSLVDPSVGGPARGMVDPLVARLEDPARAAAWVVTLPEPLVLAETRELLTQVRQRARVAVDRVIVNRLPPAVDPAALAQARQLATDHPDPWAAIAGRLEARQAAHFRAVEAIADAFPDGAGGHLDPRVETVASRPSPPEPASLAALARPWLSAGAVGSARHPADHADRDAA